MTIYAPAMPSNPTKNEQYIVYNIEQRECLAQIVNIEHIVKKLHPLECYTNLDRRCPPCGFVIVCVNNGSEWT